MKLAELKASIEAEALRRQAAQDGFTFEAIEAYLAKGIVLPAELRAEPVPPPPDPAPFAYFASLNGRELVTAAYASILGRSPDAGGLNHFMSLLARGEDKAIVVGSLRYSPEGRKRGAAVPGLFPRFAVAAARRVPVAGALVGWLVALLTLGSQRRHARAFEHFARIRMEAMAAYVAQSGAQVAMRVDALRDVLRAKD